MVTLRQFERYIRDHSQRFRFADSLMMKWAKERANEEGILSRESVRALMSEECAEELFGLVTRNEEYLRIGLDDMNAPK